jgi:hypothetical protein
MGNKLKELWRRLKLIDWLGAAFSILKAAKKKKLEVDPKHIVIKPRILSDENMLRGVAVIKTVVAFIPPAAVASPILGLGEIGFKIWKRFALSQEYDQLEFPPMDPNMLRLSIEMDTELSKHYGELTQRHNWNEEAISKLEEVYNDFNYLTNFEMLKAKYPHIDTGYITEAAERNKQNMQKSLDKIEQVMIEVSHSPEIESKIREAFNYMRELFPALNDWSLANSEGFNEVIDIVDTIM